jgi:tetratricopeptide (TPR) repeat protein
MLLHHGYSQEMTRSRQKVARNLRLLELALREQPGDPNLLMNLGLELVRSGERKEGIARYIEAFQVLNSGSTAAVAPELREALLTQLSTHLLASKRFADVAQVLQSTLARASGLTASMHLTLGLALLEIKQWAAAAEEFRHCIAKRNLPALTPIDPHVGTAMPHHCLAQAWAGLARWADAEKCFKDALAVDSTSSGVRLDFARYLHQRGRSVEGLQLLHQMLSEHANVLEVWLLGGDIALSAPDFLEFASDWTAEAVKNHPKEECILRQRAQVLMMRGELASAAGEWRKLNLSGRPSDRAGLILCQLGSGADLEPVSASEESSASKEFLAHYRRLLNSTAKTTIATINARLPQLAGTLPGAAGILQAALAEAAESIAA